MSQFFTKVAKQLEFQLQQSWFQILALLVLIRVPK